MFNFSNIRSIQLEISSYCNAACPQCPRNYFGGNTIPTLPLRKWTLTEFKKVFTPALLDQLEQVYFCGTYGDPMTNSSIVDMCKFLKDSNSKIRVGIHTNGGVGTESIYSKLAEVTDFIAFGIDGLEDTNHLYRRNTKWKKIIKNSQAFIDAGGYAIWDFIVFKHNEHQVEEAKTLSNELKFKEFNIKKTGRFLNHTHEYSNKLFVYNKKEFVDYTISIPIKQEFVNENYQKLDLVKEQFGDLPTYANQTKITCNALRIKEIYVGSDGFVFPCGWLHDRLYGHNIEGHQDHYRIKQMMHDAGGWIKANIFHTALSDIVNGNWFKEIESSWTDSRRLERCGIMCGDTVNLIGSQNKEVKYKS
jgi:MoaA/NifB/PqqE/SkfB family radical SAM enzyme